MEHTSVIRNLFKITESQMSQPQKQLLLKENQIVMGQVLKLFPEQKALIQVGSSKLIAQLETSINTFEKYWFRVKGTEQQGVSLKIMKQIEGNNKSQQSVAIDLLSLIHQRLSKENVMLVNKLLNENIPIIKEQVVSATEILKNTSKKELLNVVNAIISSVKRQLPITVGVVRSIVEAQTSVQLVKQIDQLFHALQHEKHQSKAMKQLTESLFQLIQKPVDFHVGKNMEELMSLKQLLIGAKNDTLQPLLREQIDRLIHRFHGQSLLQQQESGPTLHVITQIPFFMPKHQTDLTIQWQGKKQEDGKIDPAFCRILFYLQLPTLNETLIDVQIQNRIMNITIRNNNASLGKLVTLHSDGLKEILREMNYRLTVVNVRPFKSSGGSRGRPTNHVNIPQITTSYNGVDIKI
jgi:hypothetical protein